MIFCFRRTLRVKWIKTDSRYIYRFRDDIFVVWTHGSVALNLFLNYLNNLDDTGKIKFTMQFADENGLELLDLKLKIIEGKINVDVYSKPGNSFMYVLPSICYPYKNIRNCFETATHLWHHGGITEKKICLFFFSCYYLSEKISLFIY